MSIKVIKSAKKGKSTFLSREEKRAQQEAKRAEREAKKAAREEKKAARLEKLRIQKLPAKKMSTTQIKNVIERLDPDGKFSDKKRKAISNRIKQIGELKPGVISNRLRARQSQVDMIRYIFEEVVPTK